MGGNRSAAAITAVVIALLLVIFFHPVFFAGKTLRPPDTVESLAHRRFVTESFSSPGSLLERYPLWNPYLFSGMPSLGSLMTTPYLSAVGLSVRPLPRPVRAVALYLLLGLASWLLLRRLGVDTRAALFGAVAFIFCTHVVSWVLFGHNTKVATLVMLPLVLLATDRIMETPSFGNGAWLALAVGTLLLAAHFQIAYYALLAAGLYVVVLSVRRGSGVRFLLARWGTWVAGTVGGLLCAAILLLPVLEYSPFSTRAATGGGLPYGTATSWSFSPAEMTTFLLPAFMGFGKDTYWGAMPFTDYPHYMGLLVLFLAVVTVALYPRERLHVYLVLLAVLSLLVAFGRHLPVLYRPFYEWAPFFSRFRVPSMILVLFQFAIAVLAAIGLGRIAFGRGRDGADPPRKERERVLRRVWMVGGVFALVLVVLGVLAGSGILESWARARFEAGGGGSPDAAARAARVARMTRWDLGAAVLLLAGGVGLVWARLRRRLPGTVLVLGVLLLTVLDLWRVDAKPARYHERTDSDLEPTPAVRFLQSDPEPFRVLSLARTPGRNWLAGFGIQSIQGYHAATLEVYRDLTRGVGLGNMLAAGNFNIINILNTKYVLADREIRDPRVETVFRSSRVVMRNTEAMPRLWFVDGVRVIADRERHLRAIRDPAWDPAREAILFADPGPVDPGTGGSARITFYAPREIRATVTSPGTCLLVLSEVYYPRGWKAWLDGDPVPILRTDYVLRGFRIPPGRHALRLRFDPASFTRGAVLSGGAHAACLAVLLVSWIGDIRARGRRGPPPPRPPTNLYRKGTSLPKTDE